MTRKLEFFVVSTYRGIEGLIKLLVMKLSQIEIARLGV